MLLEAASLKSFAHSLIYEYLGKTGVKLADFCGDIIGALLILFIGFKIVSYVVKMAHKIFERSIMDTTLQTFLLSFIKIGGKVLVIFMAVTKIGVAASSIVALLGSAGLALGLSLQGSLSNIAGGVILLLLKPFQVGDYIIEGNSGKEGTVQAIGIMYTKLLSVDNKAIMIPNGNLSNASITNVTYQEKRRVDLNVGIEYSEDIKISHKVDRKPNRKFSDETIYSARKIDNDYMKISKYKDIYGEEGKKFAKVIKDNLQKEKDLDKFLMKKVDPETFNLLVSIVINTTCGEKENPFVKYCEENNIDFITSITYLLLNSLMIL